MQNRWLISIAGIGAALIGGSLLVAGPLSSRQALSVAVSPSAAAAAPAAPPDTAGAPEDDAETISLTPEQRVMANVVTAAVQRRSLVQAITAPGRITYDESRQAQVSAWIEGRIERLFVATTGSPIRKGAPMVAIYSPELVSAQQEYLAAHDGAEQARKGSYPELKAGAEQILQASRQRLRLLGVTEAQVTSLSRSRQPCTTVTIVAPTSGIVTQKEVVAGQYVETGAALFQVVDLSKVWLEADLFEGQAGAVAVGQPAVVEVAAMPGRAFRGKVELVYPSLDPQTRTLRARISLANWNHELKPEMYATARLSSPDSGRPLAVPASAVVSSGRQQGVWLEVDDGEFAPRQVQLGTKVGAYYPVLAGLKEGDKVVTQGNFLLDASAKMTADADASP